MICAENFNPITGRSSNLVIDTDGTSPNAPITWEQLAVMLYCFAKGQGYTTANDLTSSTGSNILAPTSTATRAQAAVILMNFCENVAK